MNEMPRYDTLYSPQSNADYISDVRSGKQVSGAPPTTHGSQTYLAVGACAESHSEKDVGLRVCMKTAPGPVREKGTVVSAAVVNLLD